MPTISELLFQAGDGQLKMPEFQRGWVWKTRNVKELFNSLYHGYPIGTIIVWPTKSDDGRPFDNVIDGQQRLSALYAVLRGAKPPWLGDHDQGGLGNLMFNVESETFDYGNKERLNDPLWFDVTSVFDNPDWGFSRLSDVKLQGTYAQYVQRLSRLVNGIPAKELVVFRLPENTSVEDAYRVFDIVNRAGTKVSEGDLVLGQVSLKWSGARQIIEKKLDEWNSNGFDVPLEWVLHAMSAFFLKGIEYEHITRADSEAIQESFRRMAKGTDHLQNLLRDELGFDKNQSTRFNMGLIPVLVARVHNVSQSDAHSDRQFLAWWLLGTLWYRWSADTRNRVNTDLHTISEGEGIEGLMRELRLRSEGLRLHAEHFNVRSSPSQNALKLMRILTRKYGARSLGKGYGLSFEQIGEHASLQMHHIFPRKLLRDRGVSKKMIDQVANLAFIRQDDNLDIGAKAPANYLPELEEKHPGVLASQWIPQDRRLWKAVRYPDFLDARRKLLAAAANDFLGGMLGQDLAAAERW